MTYKTISLIIVADGDASPASAIRYAVALAGRSHAHLQAGIGVPPLIIPLQSPTVEAMAVVEEENRELREEGGRLADLIRAEAETAGAVAGVEIFSRAYDPLTPHLTRMARASDLCVAMAAPPASSRQHDILVSLLIDAGAPTLIIPADWGKFGPVEAAILAWDGSSAAARAMRDATPLLCEATSVEVATIIGEKDMAGQLPGADIARHLARHCQKVSASELPVQNGSVARTLFQHARLTRADLMVMGGYGHSRLREFIFGGVTREVLAQTPIPTLISH